MPDRSFWSGRRVLLTGHTGFKGSWLSLWLTALGAEVTGYALEPPTEPSLFAQAQVERDVTSVHGDVRDYEQLHAVIERVRPEVVLHLAAQSVLHRGYDDPIETYSTNVLGTVHLLEALRRLGHACVVVNVTSDKCYRSQDWAWGYRESDALGGHDPYSSSKACSELVTEAFRESFFEGDATGSLPVRLASARAGNVIGGGDWTTDQLIPDIMRAFLDGRPCLIRHPEAIRPWQFVLEPLRGYLQLARRLATEGDRFASGWNFGPERVDARPVAWIADALVARWGDGAAWRQDAGVHPWEADHLTLDIARAVEELDWRPRLDLATSLDWIVEWYRGHRDGADLRAITLAQIERYEELVGG